MSTIAAQNYGDGTSSVPASAVLEGTAKAWVHIADAQNQALASYNVSSVTDEGIGKALVDFTNAFANADEYAFTGMTGGASAGFATTARSRQTGSLQTRVAALAGDGESDVRSSVSVFGDLA